VIEKVSEVLFAQLVTLMTSLCGNRISTDGDSSPTPMGTPDTPIVSLSPTTGIEASTSFVSTGLVELFCLITFTYALSWG